MQVAQLMEAWAAREAAMKEHLAFVVREFTAKFFPPLAPAAP
jgi:hypothetical protein